VTELTPVMKAHFDALRERMECFRTYGVQVEGWFKGEHLLLLDRAKLAQAIADFNREVKVEAGRINLRVTAGKRPTYWIALEQWGLLNNPTCGEPIAA
jgi:hypothetical protein